jgi:hypothetical protein
MTVTRLEDVVTRWQWREVMWDVHGDGIDHHRSGVRTWWWRLGILSLARLTTLVVLTF